jgi:Holliday junction resolvase
MRRAAKVDRNQAEIVKALRKAGATVQSLAAIGEGCPDVLCGFERQTVLLEIKDGTKPPSARELTPDQVQWHLNWRGGACVVVTSVGEALAAIGIDLPKSENPLREQRAF